ncbi:MAG: DUF2892 domain-containing protein [Candidatus Pacebacteria bacterium]|jgi:hypothetical protein|nr:DUF2892 domain-containing protein [Candidatus Paceibacterota bacterium]
MKKNMGNVDRIIRVLVAVLVGYLYYTGIISGTIGVALLVVAGVFVLTSIVSFCPLYTFIGVSTCKVEGEEGK